MYKCEWHVRMYDALCHIRYDVYRSTYPSTYKSTCIHASEFQMKHSKPWHKQYKHLKTSISISSTNWIDCISAYLILGNGCGYFLSIFPFQTFPQPNSISPSLPPSLPIHLSGFREIERKMCANSHRYFVWIFQMSLFWHIRNIQWAIISTLMEKVAEKRRSMRRRRRRK